MLFRSIVVMLSATGCAGPVGPNTQRGAVAGVAVGGLAGAIIGNNSGTGSGQGALIGAAIGAVAGGTLGNAKDQETQNSVPVMYRREVVVVPPPPPNYVENIPDQPAPNTAWVPGYWRLASDGIYYWVPGRWVPYHR